MLLHAVAGLLIAASSVTLPTGDGKSVPSTWHAVPDASAAARVPVIVLIADAGKSRDDWKKVAKELNGAGLSVLAIEARALAVADPYGVAVADVAAALKWLGARKDVDPEHVLVGGAGQGAMVALAAAASDVSDVAIAGLALVSPSLDADRLDDKTALADYGKRPFFVAVSKGDKRSSMSALVLDGNALGPKKIHISEGSRKGAELVSNDADSLKAFVTWAKQASGLEQPN